MSNGSQANLYVTSLMEPCFLNFRLHKLLLQPRGTQQTERSDKTSEQSMASKVKKKVGKIRVEGGFCPLILLLVTVLKKHFC